MFPPRNPFSPQQRWWYRPRTLLQPSVLLFSPSGGGSQPISDIHSAHMLTSVPVYLLSGRRPPKHHAPYIQSHSFFSCVIFFSFFLCVCVISLFQSKKKKKISSPILDFVLLLQQTTFRAPFSKERSRRHWVSVWCKTACFGWNTLPPLCSGTVQPRDWSGDGVCFCFSFKTFPSAALLGWCSPGFRCASSCEEPDGRTWRNIWGQRREEGGGGELTGGKRNC